MAKILFRFDAYLDIGLGHAIRCLSLYEELLSKGHTCFIASFKKSKDLLDSFLDKSSSIYWLENDIESDIDAIVHNGYFDLLILDSYSHDINYEKAIRKQFKYIMVIDDAPNRKHECNIILDQTFQRQGSEYAELVNSNTLILTGSNYALLRPQFVKAREEYIKRSISQVNRIFISFGGGEYSSIVKNILESISMIFTNITIDYIATRQYKEVEYIKNFAASRNLNINIHIDVKDISTLMLEADLAIGGSGVSSWERCCMGLPSISFILEDNQRTIANHLELESAIVNAGSIDKVDWYEFQNILTNILLKDTRYKLQYNSRKVCDGLGASRVVDILERGFLKHG